MSTLRSRLTYEPKELQFGTSGRRGLIADLTHLEIYINATAELEYLQSLSSEEGGIRAGTEFYSAIDLRPNSPILAEAVQLAIRDAGMHGVNLGRIPTPALMFHALSKARGSIMVTGSHIPFDRNGYKLNTSRGELLKHHEAPINTKVAEVRERIYSRSFDDSAFNEGGMLRARHAPLPAVNDGYEAYVARYLDFFPPSLGGRRILVYQHSAVGRDLLADVLSRLGADVIRAGRSDTFVPIDTENIETAQLDTIQKLANEHKGLWAIVSTDGDSDRPLVLDVDADGRVKFFGGDLLGMIVASYLNADAVVVPISCNDAIDSSALAAVLEPKTRIGSPHVIAGMEAAIAKGRTRVCGWEANGGFLLVSDIERGGKKLAALATRDALLPILSVLFAASERNVGIADLFSELPRRFSKSGLLKNFPRETGLRVVELLKADLLKTGADITGIFNAARGFTPVAGLDLTDGVRIIFNNQDVAHIRPSGNADELRIYAAAGTQARADAIVAEGVAEPGGILRSLEWLVG